jgi:hypothetical protein
MDPVTADAWIFRAFLNWFQSALSYDFSEHVILWADWKDSDRCRKLLTNATEASRPTLVCLGDDNWYVYHKAELLSAVVSSGRQRNPKDPCDRSLLRSLSLWCLLIVTEFRGITKSGRRLSMRSLWPSVRDAEVVISELSRQAREAARRWRQQPPNAQSLLCGGVDGGGGGGGGGGRGRGYGRGGGRGR